MKNCDKELFQIGEVAKIMGITRKAILVYENAGLLTPAVKDGRVSVSKPMILCNAR